MKPNANHVDVFATIAAQQHGLREPLAAPAPPPRPTRVLPVQAGSVPAAEFTPRHRVETAEELARELAELRERFAPFLRELAPPVPVTRDVVALGTFQWREETEADRQDFSRILSGAGEWQTVRIPHYGPPLGRAVTYYRTTFTVTPALRERGALFVCFKGVDYKAHVFVNGTYLGSHEGFFAPFEFEFTAQARLGENCLVVKVENDAICMGNGSWGDNGKEYEGDKLYAATGPGYDAPGSGWHHCPPGMGIYQPVRIEARRRLFVHDLFVRPLPEQNRAEAWIELWNCDTRRQPAQLTLAVFGRNFEAVAAAPREVALPGPPGPGVNYYRFQLDLPDHRPWSPDAPWLYQLQVELRDADGNLLDAATRSFGMRSFTMDTATEPRGRFFLNGKEIRLRGANTMGFEQQAVMRGEFDRLVDDLLLAKLCHMNFLRLTQRPVQEEVYDYCDRLGMMTQTDLPLFGVLRRNQFAEAIRQAGEMERLVRAHPCNILVSYINEPFPVSWLQHHRPWRNLSRPELELFFDAADHAVHIANPDRVTKPVDGDYDPPAPGLPDNHCYTLWYNGHGIDFGKLHRGYWQPVKSGWFYGCGEFGAEGLDPVDLMRRRYPPAWLPQSAEEEAQWTPERIPYAQTGKYAYNFFDIPRGLAGWVAASQAHQAWATRAMTEAFRRDARMNSMAIHLFIDAFPAGWMKTIMDVERRPKPAYFAYREALTPLMVNLRSDRFAFWAGETAEWEVWICNDTHESPPNARLAYRLEIAGRTVASGVTTATVPICSSQCQGLLQLPLPELTERTRATLRLALLDANGTVRHDTAVEFPVFPRLPALPKKLRVAVLGSATGPATRLANELGITAEPWHGPAQQPDCVWVDDPALLRQHLAQLQAAVEHGATVVLLEIPPGELELPVGVVRCQPCGMHPVHFVSRATGHPLVAGFEPNDFRLWYDPAADCCTPLLETIFEAEGWTPILTSGWGGWQQPWRSVLAAAERPAGAGLWRICNVKLAGRLTHNPVAAEFARRLLIPTPAHISAERIPHPVPAA